MSNYTQTVTTVFDAKVTAAYERGARNLKVNLEEHKKLEGQLNHLQDEIRNAGKGMQEFGDKSVVATQKVNSSVNGLTKGLGDVGKIVAAYFTVDAVLSFGKAVFEVTAEMQKMEAVLTNSLGSKSAAKAAMQMIQDFAAKTPYSVRELTESYVQLANRGINPTVKTMTAMGDLASALGKPLQQVNEAILDVSNSERWNELGVKVKVSGDKIIGTFRGMTVEAEKTEQGALKMVQTFGEMQGVANGMAQQAATIGGAYSNLGDSFDKLLLAIGGQGAGMATGLIGSLSGLLEGLANLIGGGNETGKALEALADKSGRLILKNREQASTASGLLKRYEELTANGLTPTGKAKQELDLITLKLRDTLGESVIAIDKETGALTLNKEAVREAIKQKLLLNNQEASSLALRVNALNEQIAEQQRVVNTEKQIFNTRLQALRDFGLSAEMERKLLDKNRTGGVQAFKQEVDELGRLTQLSKDRNKAHAEFTVQSVALGNAEKDLNAIQKDREILLRKLNELGFNAADIERLFTESLEESAKANDKQSNAIEGRLAKLRKELKLVTDLREKAVSEKEIAAHNIRMEQIQAEIKRLEDLRQKRDITQEIKFKASGDDNSKAAMDELFKLEEARLEKNTQLRKNAITETGMFRKKSTAEIDAEIEQQEVMHLITMLQLAQEYGQDTADLEQQLLDKRLAAYRKNEEQKTTVLKTEAQKRRENEELIQEALTNLAITSTNLFLQHHRDSLQVQMQDLQYERDYAIELAGDNVKAKLQIEKEYQEKNRQLRQKAAVAEKAQALFEIGLNVAKGIAQVNATVAANADITQTTRAILTAIVVGAGLAQTAAVMAKPIPRYAKGTRNVTGGIHGQDSVLAMLMPGEAVITTATNKAYSPALNAIHNNAIPPAAMNNFAMNFDKYTDGSYLGTLLPKLDENFNPNNSFNYEAAGKIMGGIMREELTKMGFYQMSYDEDGIRKRWVQGLHREEILNKRNERCF